MKATGGGRGGVEPALAWSNGLRVEVGGPGTVAHAGVVLPRLLADRLGLTTDLAGVVARAGFSPLRHRGRLLVDAACALTGGRDRDDRRGGADRPGGVVRPRRRRERYDGVAGVG